MAIYTFNSRELEKGLQELDRRTDAAIKELANRGAQEIEDYAKNNAPWVDRTGEARRTLKGSTSPIANGVRITLSHGVDYGVYLELAHEKRFAILMQAIRTVGVKSILPAFNKLLR